VANDFYTPAQAVQVAAKLAAEDAFLTALVSRNYENDLLGGGKGGAPVAIKMPTTLIARSRDIDDVTSAIVLDEIKETTKTVNLDRAHDYSAVGLSEADLSLNLTDFAAQVLRPQTAAIVDSLEHKVALALAAVPETFIRTFDPENPVPYFTAIRKHLRDNGVPASGIQTVVGTEVYAALLDAKAITDASESGSTEALREGGVGRIRGFNIVESTRIDENEVLAFHRDAVTLVTRAPVVPQGAPFGAMVADSGFQLRYLRDYDAKYTQDRSIVSTFSGVGILPTYKIERNYTTRAVETTELPYGGVLRMDATATA
jgi:hypothetical protein